MLDPGTLGTRNSTVTQTPPEMVAPKFVVQADEETSGESKEIGESESPEDS